jgi:hypothetical protein
MIGKKSVVVPCPVQVLDDSSEKEVQQLIRDEVDAWMVRGAPIVYHARQDICTHTSGGRPGPAQIVFKASSC